MRNLALPNHDYNEYNAIIWAKDSNKLGWQQSTHNLNGCTVLPREWQPPLSEVDTFARDCHSLMNCVYQAFSCISSPSLSHMVLHLHEFSQALAIVASNWVKLLEKLIEVREKVEGVIKEYTRKEDKLLCKNLGYCRQSYPDPTVRWRFMRTKNTQGVSSPTIFPTIDMQDATKASK